MEKWTAVLISCVIMYVTRGRGIQKSEIFADVSDRSPLMNCGRGQRPSDYFDGQTRNTYTYAYGNP